MGSQASSPGARAIEFCIPAHTVCVRAAHAGLGAADSILPVVLAKQVVAVMVLNAALLCLQPWLCQALAMGLGMVQAWKSGRIL